jgi:long-chain acyl-CoA synthetase
MNQRVDALAHGLRRLGIRPKDVCILMMPSCPHWTLVYSALAKMGTIVVPVNPLYRQGELGHIFRDSGARAFVGHVDYLKEPSLVIDSTPHI